MVWKTLFIALLAVGAYAEVQIPSEYMQRYDTVLRNMCIENGGSEHFDDVKAASMSFINCVSDLFEVQTISKEIQEAMPHGTLGETVKKYCAKTPELKNCVFTVLEAIKPCISEKIRSDFDDVKNSTSQLLDFICYKDGERVTSFFTEGGPVCLESKAAEIRNCQVTKLSRLAVEDSNNISWTEKCQMYDEWSSCIVTELEKCDSPTPARITESFLVNIKSSKYCPKKN